MVGEGGRGKSNFTPTGRWGWGFAKGADIKGFKVVLS